MSFQKAAEELHVTPAALSYQIRQLEEHLEIKLFNRLNRAVELTNAGRLLAIGVEESFSVLRRTLTKTLKAQGRKCIGCFCRACIHIEVVCAKALQVFGAAPEY